MDNKYKKRKNLRIANYNYSKEGYYFITICTQNKRCILSKIVDNNTSDLFQLIILPYGKITEKYIKSCNDIYNDIQIQDYVIMPNHIHFICSITNSIDSNFENANSANDKLPALISTLKRLINKECHQKIWQRNYYEHVIRNEKEYLEILNYIQNNPLKWKLDKYYNL